MAACPTGARRARRMLRCAGRALTVLGVLAAAFISAAPAGAGTRATTRGAVMIVAAENEYGNVAAQIGGMYVRVDSVESNPNTDPHSYEVSPRVAQEVSAAQVVIQNGLGYDAYMTKVESASPRSRQVIDVQHLLRLPDSTPNPHLWYRPTTMPKVADTLAADLARLDPAHAAYFTSRAATFTASLRPWLAALAHFKSTHLGVAVATTEPVADYLLQAAGAHIETPFALQADIMNGVDPSPQAVSLQDSLLARHKVKVLVYNQQVTDTLTQSFIAAAKQARIPIIGVYETMPAPGYDYQSWMLAETNALQKAVVGRTSTEKL
jgi:zinc/manganese transport system substrate-binding protein